MDYLPIFLKVEDRKCLVVGGGKVAARKVALLKRAGAHITIVSPQLCDGVHALLEQGGMTHVTREFQDRDLDDCVLVIAATDAKAVNRRISELANAQRIPVNTVDSPDLCSFIMPSMIDRSPVQIAVSTGGASPVLARLLRSRLESFIPAAYGRLAQLVDDYRERVKQRFKVPDQRRYFWENILQGRVAELLFAGHEEKARTALQEAIDDTDAHYNDPGEVYLVGAGPGDPDLITFRALRLMQQADVVVYDRLVSEPVLDMVRRDAEMIYAGKARDQHTLSQESINQLLVRLAKEGKRVLRLKGGDPFIFGRGGEEIETLAEEGIPFQVVPGITAASGCASYAGIPLTHRDYAQSCIFVTGHLKDGSVDLDWEKLAKPAQTIVFYMGLHSIPAISRELVAHGLPATTPVALVQQGTTHKQRVYIETLGSMKDLNERETLKPPTIIIVGEVVSLHEKLSWFGMKKS
ncbi:MAG: siroheme synthase CysG [Gammaproteobacteria bacterium]|jgi:uroporphyrin-III C-methyltransferase/precorrin-2 dehydrogenase/sirohydrochlorin ferrochelatase